MSTHAARALADTLTQQHAALAADGGCSEEEAVRDTDADLPLQFAAVAQACRRLGFVEHDVHVITQAWQAQTQRTGQFDPMTWPQTPSDFGVAPWPRAHAFAPCPSSLGLYAVLPDATWVQRMAHAGVPTVQLRFKSDDMQAIAREVRAAVRAVEGTPARLFINDHWQIALDEGAYGVHLGQEDMDDAPLEQLRTAGLRLGLSTHGYAEMLRADAVSPSYLALGAVFPTTLKRMKTAPQGLGRLRAYARLMQGHSLVAIGGIDAQTMDEVMQSGVGSIAVVRAITAAADPIAAAHALEKIIAAHREPS